jgi:predicted nucleotidyltransferase
MKLSHPMMSVTGGLEGAVLEVLAGTTSPLGLGDVHRLAAVASKSGVRKALLRLVDSGIVHVVPGGYVLNRDHVASGPIIDLARLRGVLFERITAHIRGWRSRVELAGVFGSLARREGNEDSDIDVLVVADSVPDGAVGGLAAHVEKWAGNECHIVVLTRKELERAKKKREPIVDSWRKELVVLLGDRSLID